MSLVTDKLTTKSLIETGELYSEMTEINRSLINISNFDFFYGDNQA